MFRAMAPGLFQARGPVVPVCFDYLIPRLVPLARTGQAKVYFLVDGDKCMGEFIGTILRNLFSGEKEGTQISWHARPETGGHSLRLLRAFEQDCKEAGCKRIICGSVTGSPAGLDGLFVRLGFKHFGTSYERLI